LWISVAESIKRDDGHCDPEDEIYKKAETVSAFSLLGGSRSELFVEMLAFILGVLLFVLEAFALHQLVVHDMCGLLSNKYLT